MSGRIRCSMPNQRHGRRCLTMRRRRLKSVSPPSARNPPVVNTKELVMASINLGRVVAGGLVAGVVANAIDFVTNTYVLASDIAAWAPTRNLDPAVMNSGPVAATWI